MQKSAEVGKNKNFKLEIKFLLTKILLSIANNYKNTDLRISKNLIKRKFDLNRLSNLLFLIQEDYSRNITLDEASKITYLSLNYFCNFFKHTMGCTFSEYLLRIRLDKAKEFLITEKLSITEIAYKIGFKNLSYFFRKFKQLTGVTSHL